MSTYNNNSCLRLWLDSYEDMFSSFDPRPLSQRTWSDDFIDQIKRASKEFGNKKTNLHLLIPATQRKFEDEKILSRRLIHYFRNKNGEISNRRKKAYGRSLFLILAGILMMTIVGYITYLLKENSYWHLVLQIFEPAGWFLVWTGLEALIKVGSFKSELSFYRNMSAAQVEFGSY